MKTLVAVASMLLLCACGTAKTVVMEPIKSDRAFRQLTLQEGESPVPVPAEVSSHLRAVLEKGLYQSSAFAPGPELTLAYKFVSHDEGSQFARWFWGGIGNAGEGSLTVHVRYVDSTGAELATTQVEGRIGSGFFGGSFQEAVTRLGEDMVKFTIANFGADAPVRGK